jgi:hypothetical protein
MGLRWCLVVVAAAAPSTPPPLVYRDRRGAGSERHTGFYEPVNAADHRVFAHAEGHPDFRRTEIARPKFDQLRVKGRGALGALGALARSHGCPPCGCDNEVLRCVLSKRSVMAQAPILVRT